MMYTRLLSLLFAFLFTATAANATSLILLDGIENGRVAGPDNVKIIFDERFTPETIMVITITNADGSFVKEITMVPSVSTEITTFLKEGSYVVNTYNFSTGKVEKIRFMVS